MYRTKSISYGDKIFARVTRNGQIIYDFVSEKVANMADLIGQLRMAIKDVRGLVMIHIRNYHQGWGEQRPLMLYAPKIPNYKFAGDTQDEHPYSANKYNSRMLFPWETH